MSPDQYRIMVVFRGAFEPVGALYRQVAGGLEAIGARVVALDPVLLVDVVGRDAAQRQLVRWDAYFRPHLTVVLPPFEDIDPQTIVVTRAAGAHWVAVSAAGNAAGASQFDRVLPLGDPAGVGALASAVRRPGSGRAEIEGASELCESVVRLALRLEKTGRPDSALHLYRWARDLDPQETGSLEGIVRLTPDQAERRACLEAKILSAEPIWFNTNFTQATTLDRPTAANGVQATLQLLASGEPARPEVWAKAARLTVCHDASLSAQALDRLALSDPDSPALPLLRALWQSLWGVSMATSP